MAKALIGYLSSDPRGLDRLAVENARLRKRVAELEALTLKLSEENDALVEAHASQLLSSEMQPA